MSPRQRLVFFGVAIADLLACFGWVVGGLACLGGVLAAIVR